MQAWAAFAEDPRHGLERLDRPMYEKAKDTLVQLALDRSSLPVYGAPTAFDAACVSLELSYWDLPA